MESDNLNTAVSDLTTAVDLKVDDPSVYYTRGVAYLHSDELQKGQYGKLTHIIHMSTYLFLT